MSDPRDEPTSDEPSGVDRLLSRFGPVPETDPTRETPGPRPGADGLERPTPGPRPTPAAAKANQPTGRPQRARLFDEPHDEVFGDTMVRIDHPIQEDLELAYDGPVEIIDRREWVRMPRRTGPAFRFLVVAFVIGIGVAFTYGRVTTWYDDSIDPPGEPGEVLTEPFKIASGATSNEVTQNLYANDVIANPTLFRYWLANNSDSEFLAGDYDCLRTDMSFDEALQCLNEGPIPPSFFSVTIREGLTLEEIIDELASYGLNKAELRQNLDHQLVTVDLIGKPTQPLPDSPDPTGTGREGLLFPATYQIDDKLEEPEREILVRMAQTMQQRFEAAQSEGEDQVIEDLGLTEYEILTIASLIEKEAQTDADRPKIARVIYNRLLQGNPLGIDATSCYAAQKSCADLTQADLDNPSEWNTRAPGNLGLPPTPIASPGDASIKAALQPEPGDWFYYVRTEEDGGHTFAVTDAEFQAAKAVCVERGYC